MNVNKFFVFISQLFIYDFFYSNPFLYAFRTLFKTRKRKTLPEKMIKIC